MYGTQLFILKATEIDSFIRGLLLKHYKFWTWLMFFCGYYIEEKDEVYYLCLIRDLPLYFVLMHFFIQIFKECGFYFTLFIQMIKREANEAKKKKNK